MAASPRWKVYRGSEYLAACKHVEEAAVLVAFLGDGATIRLDHAARFTVWTEGKEDQSAGESYDHVVSTVERRIAEWNSKRAILRGEEN